MRAACRISWTNGCALVDMGDAPGLAKAIVNEIKAATKATKGPFGSDYALKDF
jgi:hypothetical protein